MREESKLTSLYCPYYSNTVFFLHKEVPSDRLRSGHCKSEYLLRYFEGYLAATTCTVTTVTVAAEYPQRYFLGC